MASCWVMVEPPCEAPRRKTSAMPRAGDSKRIDAVMRIEAAVLDGDKRVGNVVRQFRQRHRRAAHVAAGRKGRAVVADDQHRGRAFGDFERLNRRQMDADPDQRADAGDGRPQRQHHAPVEQARPMRERRLPPRRVARRTRRRRPGAACEPFRREPWVGRRCDPPARRRRSRPSASPRPLLARATPYPVPSAKGASGMAPKSRHRFSEKAMPAIERHGKGWALRRGYWAIFRSSPRRVPNALARGVPRCGDRLDSRFRGNERNLNYPAAASFAGLPSPAGAVNSANSGRLIAACRVAVAIWAPLRSVT